MRVPAPAPVAVRLGLCLLVGSDISNSTAPFPSALSLAQNSSRKRPTSPRRATSPTSFVELLHALAQRYLRHQLLQFGRAAII